MRMLDGELLVSCGKLEEQLVTYGPGGTSPDRLDACVHG
jgi:phage terminase large subunit-like protein